MWFASRRDGTNIIESNWGEGQGVPWYSDDGRYMAGVNAGEKKSTAWVLDTRTGKILVRKHLKYSDEYKAVWRHGAFTIHGFDETAKPLAVLRS